MSHLFWYKTLNFFINFISNYSILIRIQLRSMPLLGSKKILISDISKHLDNIISFNIRHIRRQICRYQFICDRSISVQDIGKSMQCTLLIVISHLYGSKSLVPNHSCTQSQQDATAQLGVPSASLCTLLKQHEEIPVACGEGDKKTTAHQASTDGGRGPRQVD